MLVHFILGLFIAVISGLGIGGGGLFAVYLAVCTDTPQLAVQGFNLLFFIFCSASSVAVQVFKRKIMFGAVAVMILGGIVGAVGGSMLATVVSEKYLRQAFGVMLVGSGIFALQNAPKKRKNARGESK